MGGYVRSVNCYTSARHGDAAAYPGRLRGHHQAQRHLGADRRRHELVLAFGGMALKNTMVAGGGISQHVERGAMARRRRRGCEFVLISPLRDDLPDGGRRGMDAPSRHRHRADAGAGAHAGGEGLHDRAFLDRYTVGWPVFERYLTGESDGQPKDAAWAAAITGIAADTIVALARRAAGRRTLVIVSHSLQRAEHGEQPVWMGVVLAATLGQIGLPGGGYAYSLGAIGYYGRRDNAVPADACRKAATASRDFIPVARIADMLLNPGPPIATTARRPTYPDIRLVYWAGGNPFHHHQDINRLRKAFAQVDTLVVHEIGWTATARHADFVLPATMTLEREDIGDPPTIP